MTTWKSSHIDKCLYEYLFRDGWSNSTFTRNKAIQDHLELGRSHYAEEFKKVNDRRLSKIPDEKEIALTVVVPSMASRWSSLGKVLPDLFKQAEGKPVEVVCLLDNKKSNLSEKRNQAIKAAKGTFITFVDDDDEVESDYVDSLLKSIKENPSVDCVVFDVEVYGYTSSSKRCKYGIEYQHGEDEKAYYRKPNHVMAYRTQISRKHLYRLDLSAISEDTEWAERASKDIRSQARIDKVLYHYFYNEKETTQLKPAKSAPPTASTPPLKDVSFIVLEAAELDLTTKCLKSIKEHAPGAEIILVGNGCPLSQEKIDLATKSILVETNVGFAAGCNLGAKQATRDIVCFMNNDALFVDDTPSKMAAMIQRDPNSIVAPYSNRAKPPQGDVARDRVPEATRDEGMVVGLCMMVKKEVFQSIGGFDPRFLTYEDDDFCRRALRKGHPIRICGGAWVDHERHATFEKLGLDVQKVMQENEQTFRRKNPSIRVIVIAKDEERSLEGFFKQFKGITNDWCLLDTGSTDGTIEKAEELEVRVESSEFKDFAWARNEAIRRFGAGADWIIMFDPDERLDPHTLLHLREFLFNTSADIVLAPLTAKYPDGSKKEFVPKPFIFRNKPEIKWVFKVHEKLIGSKRQVLIKNAIIEHEISLHDDGRREKMASFYNDLSNGEPYFTDPEYRKKMCEEWPILDYGRHDDPRILKTVIGPLVSVIVPTYKRAQLLFPAIQSVLTQDYTNLELLVVGDNCPDIQKMKSVNFPWFPKMRILNLNKNHGAGGAVPRNHGIIAAAGDLIAYLDDDNRWKPNHLSSLYLHMEDAAFTFSSMEVDGVDLGFKVPAQGSIDTSCILHEKYLIDKYGYWKSQKEAGYPHDWELVNRWIKGKEMWSSTERPTVIYNAATSSQKEYLQALIEKKRPPEKVPEKVSP